MATYIDKKYKTFVGNCDYADAKFGMYTFPWAVDTTAEKIATEIENKASSEGWNLLRLRISIDWKWTPFPRYEVRTEIWAVPSGGMRLNEKKLGEAVFGWPALVGLIAVCIAVIFLGYIIWKIYERGNPTAIEQFICPICNREFANSSAYDTHMCVEHGQCYYTCPYCGARFDTAEQLERHITEMHKQEKVADMIKWMAYGLIALGGVLIISRLIPTKTIVEKET